MQPRVLDLLCNDATKRIRGAEYDYEAPRATKRVRGIYNRYVRHQRAMKRAEKALHGHGFDVNFRGKLEASHREQRQAREHFDKRQAERLGKVRALRDQALIDLLDATPKQAKQYLVKLKKEVGEDLMLFKRKHSAYVDAIQWEGENLKDVQTFMFPQSPLDHANNSLGVNVYDSSQQYGQKTKLIFVAKGSWIVRDEDGNLHAYTNEQFEATFEPIALEGSIPEAPADVAALHNQHSTLSDDVRASDL